MDQISKKKSFFPFFSFSSFLAKTMPPHKTAANVDQNEKLYKEKLIIGMNL